MSLNAEILTWARETAGLTPEDAARAISLGDARGLSGEERLLSFERGEAVPSKALLKKMAKQYRRPILTFYLPKLPSQTQIGPDFRTVHDVDQRENALLKALLREIEARQSLVKDLLEDEEREPIKFVGSLTLDMPVIEAAKKISEQLNFVAGDFQGHNQGVPGAFAYARRTVEDAGIFVLLASNLGSWQTTIGVDVFRGFVIADEAAPFVVINDQDAQTAWAFTLFHECVHIWLGEGGISGGLLSGNAVESFCNRVAARILLGPAGLNGLRLSDQMSLEDKARAISDFASRRNLGRSMIVYQALSTGELKHGEASQLFTSFAAQWRARRQAEKDRQKDVEGGPNYYVVKRHRLGNKLVETVRSALSEGAIGPSRASRMLGVKPSSVYPLVFPTLRRGEI